MIEDEEMKNLYQAESEEKLKNLEKQLAKLEINSDDKEALDTAFREAHSMKGSARMLKLQPIESMTHQFESSLDQIRKKEIPLTPQGIQVFYETLDVIQSLVNEALTGKPANVNLTLCLNKLMLKIPSSSQETKEPQEEEKKITTEEHSLSISTVRIDVEQINQLMNLAADLMVTRNRMIRFFERIENLLEVWEEQSQGDQSPYYSGRQRELLSLHLKEKKGLQSNNQQNINPLFKAFKERGENLNKIRNDAYEDVNKLELITSSIGDQIRKLSLIPLSKLFDFFPRSVRELGRVEGKEIELIVEGEDISVDKKIIEGLKDPLMHILRNAVSHGIETPEEREREGKPRRGTIHLTGKQTSNNIFIEISDDGQGINLEKIKEVALKRGMINEEKVKTLTLSEAYSLILLPGFSTTPQVDELSGRGVGLDVVKTEVEHLQGTLKIDSQQNHGSRFTIKLPIFFITTQVILIDVEKKRYALPIDLIETCLMVSSDQIAHDGEMNKVILENQSIPLLFFREFVGLHPINESDDQSRRKKGNEGQSCIVMKMQEKRLAVIVDKILDEEKVVVIPPDTILSKVKSVLGTTILKTGEACVILNPFLEPVQNLFDR